MKRGLLVIAAALLASAAGACAKPPVGPSTVYIRVIDEAKQPVPAAEIASGATVVSRTNPDGRAEVTISGSEGTMYEVEVRCPLGYRASKGAAVAVRKFDPSIPPAEYVSTCARNRHSLAVEVHADGGPDLPVLYLGKEVGRTDAQGNAKIQLDGDVHDRIELTLSTAAPELAKMHPQNPFASFEVEEHDVTKPFDVKFTKDKPKKRKSGRQAGDPSVLIGSLASIVRNHPFRNRPRKLMNPVKSTGPALARQPKVA